MYERKFNTLKNAIVEKSEEDFEDALKMYGNKLMSDGVWGIELDVIELLETAYSNNRNRFAFMVAYLSHMGGRVEGMLSNVISKFMLFDSQNQAREIEELEKIIKIVFYNLKTSQSIGQGLRSPEYINPSLRNEVLKKLYHSIENNIIENVHDTINEPKSYIEYLLKVYGMAAEIFKNNRAEVDDFPAVLKKAFLNVFTLLLILDPASIKIDEFCQILRENGDNNVTINSILEDAYNMLNKIEPEYELIGNQPKPDNLKIFEAKFELFKLAKQKTEIDLMYKILKEAPDLMTKLSTLELKQMKNVDALNHRRFEEILQNRIEARKNIGQSVLTNYIKPIVNPKEYEEENSTEEKVDSIWEIGCKLASHAGTFFYKPEKPEEPKYKIDLSYIAPLDRETKLIREGTGIDIDDGEYNERETELSSQIAGLIARYIK